MTQITITQAAKLRGVEKSTIWRWIKAYHIKAERIGGFMYLVDKEEVINFQPPQRGPKRKMKVNDE